MASFLLFGCQDEVHGVVAAGEAQQGCLKGPILMALEAPDDPRVFLMAQEHHIQPQVVTREEQKLTSVLDTSLHILQKTFEGAD